MSQQALSTNEAAEAAQLQLQLQLHAQMVAQLRRPGALAGASGPAALIETHLSSLLLSGDRVYKLKRPVKFGFVDFSTLALRREACLQELRVNHRTAPRHYLAVVPVCQAEGGAVVADADAALAQWPGPVVDWAVQMRRFDDHQRFDRLARGGRLTAAQVDALAEQVARFHGQQAPAPPGCGRAEATRHWARENLVELAALLPVRAAGTLLSGAADTVTALQRWTEARGAALAPQMELRRATGHVREVHGDLHLANIAWVDGAALLFDALEFNDSLRHIDTIGDLAFVFMDLQAQGQPKLAWRFISAALAASGDHAALPLLAWWAVYRAAVRAKVALLAGDAAGPSQAQVYLQLAARLAGLPQDLPDERGATGPAPTACRLVLMFGLSGSGKSTVSALLAERIGAVRLRADVERKRLFALPPSARAAPSLGLYSAEATRRTSDRLHELAGAALQAGVSVVVDTASLRRGERNAMRALAARHGARFTLMACSAPLARLADRLERRAAAGSDASDATLEVLDQQQRWAEWPGADEAADTLWLDTDLPRDELARRCDALGFDTGDECAAPRNAG